MIGGIVILAGILLIPVASAHGTDTTKAPTEPTEPAHSEEYTHGEHTPHHSEETYRDSCHGGGTHHNGYDTHHDNGWFGGQGMMPWFGW